MIVETENEMTPVSVWFVKIASPETGLRNTKQARTSSYKAGTCTTGVGTLCLSLAVAFGPATWLTSGLWKRWKPHRVRGTPCAARLEACG